MRATLRTLREQIGLTQDEVGEKCGVDPSWVSRLENGGAPLFIDHIKLAASIAAIYGVDVEAIPRMARRRSR